MSNIKCQYYIHVCYICIFIYLYAYSNKYILYLFAIYAYIHKLYYYVLSIPFSPPILLPFHKSLFLLLSLFFFISLSPPHLFPILLSPLHYLFNCALTKQPPEYQLTKLWNATDISGLRAAVYARRLTIRKSSR